DVSLRLPDDLRSAEGLLREQLGQVVKRGKVDIRVNYTLPQRQAAPTLDAAYLQTVAQQLQAARAIISDLAPPALLDLLKGAAGADHNIFEPEVLNALCHSACVQALDDFQANPVREDGRLADMMMQFAQ